MFDEQVCQYVGADYWLSNATSVPEPINQSSTVNQGTSENVCHRLWGKFQWNTR
jgi:hypothetical protein